MMVNIYLKTGLIAAIDNIKTMGFEDLPAGEHGPIPFAALVCRDHEHKLLAVFRQEEIAGFVIR